MHLYILCCKNEFEHQISVNMLYFSICLFIVAVVSKVRTAKKNFVNLIIIVIGFMTFIVNHAYCKGTYQACSLELFKVGGGHNVGKQRYRE